MPDNLFQRYVFLAIDSFHTRHMHKRLHLILVGILGSGFLYHYSLWKKKKSFDKNREFKQRLWSFHGFIKCSSIKCVFNQKSLFKETSIICRKKKIYLSEKETPWPIQLRRTTKHARDRRTVIRDKRSYRRATTHSGSKCRKPAKK